MKGLKALIEKRNDLHEKMEGIVNLAKNEARALTADETAQFESYEKQVEELDKTIDMVNKLDKNRKLIPYADDSQEVKDVKAFADYIRGIVNADAPIKKGENGALVPATIANKIIDKIYDICPIYQLAERYNVGGTLTIPYVDEENTTLSMTYATEFVTPDATTLKTASVSLAGFLGEALTKISKSLINNSDFDIVSLVVDKMAKEIAVFIEKECIKGTDGKILGLRGVTKTVTTAAATAITSDELIDLQEEVPDVYQADSIWIMNKETRKAIRKLKDGDGKYLLERDFTSKWNYTLLGKPVYTTESMDAIGAGKTAIYYGDMSGLAIKLSEDINIDILKEVYAAQHALGVVGFVELDAKVQDASKIAKLVCKTI